MEEKVLDEDYWSSLYLDQDTGWDVGYPTHPIKNYIDQLENKSLQILIPGCGNAHEAAYLLEKGFTGVTLVDISPVPVETLKKKWAGESIEIIREDFFDHVGQYDLILEQTFFCALSPKLRPEYAAKMPTLLKPGGKVVGVLFNRDFDESPPFGGSKEEYEKLFAPHFSSVSLEPCYNSITPRAGFELFIQLKK